MPSLLILGAGGHGRVVAEMARESGRWDNLGFLDDSLPNSPHKEKMLKGFRCFGGFFQYLSNDVRAEFSDAIVALGNNQLRLRWLEMLKEAGYCLPTLLHPSAIISQSAILGEGSVVMPGVVVNTNATIGVGCILNTMCSIDHDCMIEDGVHISPGAHLGGEVSVGRRSWVCIGASISHGINIASDCIIGAGAALVSDTEALSLYVGVPARKKKSLNVKE